MKVKGKKLRPGYDYHSTPSPARYAVDCICGFSTDVPGAGSEAEAETMIAARHSCKDRQLIGYPYACEACGDVTAHGDLIPIKNNGASAVVCDHCRVQIALGRLGMGKGQA